MRHGGRRTFGVVLFLIVSMTLGGCIFFDKERRNNFKGPSWDVPLALPLKKKEQVFISDLFIEMLDGDGQFSADGKLGFSVKIDDHITIPLPVGWDTLPGSHPGSSATIAAQDVALPALPTLGDSGSFELVLEELQLKLTISNEISLDGELELEVNGGARTAEKVVPLDSATPKKTVALVVDIDDATETLSIGGTLTVFAGAEPASGDLVIQPEAWAPLAFKVTDNAVVDFLDPVQLDFDDETRDTINNVPLSEFALGLEMDSHSPFGFEFGFVISDDSGEQPLDVSVHVPGDAHRYLDEIVIDEDVRTRLTAPGAQLKPKLTVLGAGEGATIYVQREHFFTYKLHALVHVDINKQEDE